MGTIDKWIRLDKPNKEYLKVPLKLTKANMRMVKAMVDLIVEANEFVTNGVKKTIKNRGIRYTRYFEDLIFEKNNVKIAEDVMKASPLRMVSVSELKYSVSKKTPTRKTKSPPV